MAQRTCVQCGGDIPLRKPGVRGRQSMYCSKSCGAKSSRTRNARGCSVDGCVNPHGARGLCYSHYGAWHREVNGRTGNSTRYPIICVQCGAEHMSARPEGKFCSSECKGKNYTLTKQTKCKLPADHPVMVERQRLRNEQAAASTERRRERDRIRSLAQFEWRTERECPGCASRFTPIFTPNMLTCSKRCSRRVQRWRRKAREVNAYGDFTWSEFMRLAQRFDFRCAYCGDKPGQLDPDHVVPLSRGGHNSTTNLLPACRRCNGDKRNLLLNEWAVDREAKGKPPVATNWPPEDKRYWHLTQVVIHSAA